MSNVSVEELVESLSSLSVLDMAKLKDLLQEKWGVEAVAAAPVAVAAPQAGEAEAAAESTEFQVTLAEAPADKKMAIIKVVRQITGLGLKESKEIAEGAPKVLKESVNKSEAEEIKKSVEEAGGKATLKGL
ncbi:MAG: 50S ribosomal protein L7/L12 [Chlamydiae bacterium]|nr:50S ribosomal protein L7/L12 [Chlamydiota bacterium]